MDWLDEIIEKQKVNRDILKSLSEPYDPAELQEMADSENWEADKQPSED